jgi:hypothetical protein
MSKFKDYGLVWWITEIIGLALIVAVVIFEIYINYSLFHNDTVTYNQKIVNLAGAIMICYGWSFAADWVVQKLRKFIRNKTN